MGPSGLALARLVPRGRLVLARTSITRRLIPFTTRGKSAAPGARAPPGGAWCAFGTIGTTTRRVGGAGALTRATRVTCRT